MTSTYSNPRIREDIENFRAVANIPKSTAKHTKWVTPTNLQFVWAINLLNNAVFEIPDKYEYFDTLRGVIKGDKFRHRLAKGEYAYKRKSGITA